jgi:hypothetical protein
LGRRYSQVRFPAIQVPVSTNLIAYFDTNSAAARVKKYLYKKCIFLQRFVM